MKKKKSYQLVRQECVGRSESKWRGGRIYDIGLHDNAPEQINT